MQHLDVLQLVEQSKAGDRDAFAELILRHQAQVFRVAYRLLGSREAAQDVSQDVFVKAFLALDTWQPDAVFAAWLLRIARNACLDQLRIQQRRPQVGLDQLTQPEPLTTASTERQAIARQELTLVENALGQLPAEHREIVVLRDIEGFSYEEIAQMLQINSGTVRSRLSRARAALLQKTGRSK